MWWKGKLLLIWIVVVAVAVAVVAAAAVVILVLGFLLSLIYMCFLSPRSVS